MKRIVMFSILMLLSVDGLAKTQYPDNVNLFRHAIRDENRPLIREVVQKIAEEDEEAVAYMKENLPKDFVIYKLWETAIEIREIGGKEPVEVETESLKASSGAGGNEGVTNRDLTEGFDNQSRADNASIARDNLNQDRISNNDLTDHFSNRNRISNRERLRSGSRRR